MYSGGFERGRAESENLDIINTGHKKASEVLSHRINMNDFPDYDLKADNERVQKMKQIFEEKESHYDEFEKTIQKTAEIFEAIIFQQAGISGWLGSNAKVYQSAEFDDYFNGVDQWVEYIKENGRKVSHIAFAIDATTSHELTGKFERIFSEIEKGTLTEIKYFASKALHFKGRKYNVPRVVVGADRKTILDLTEKWLEQNSKDEKVKKESAKALSEHVIQAIILIEIHEQLKSFKIVSERSNHPELVSVFEKAIILIEEIIKEKDFSEDMLYLANQDNVLQAIKDNLAYASR